MSRDQNLLFGLLAVQLDKVTPSQLAEAAALWAGDPTTPLHQHLTAAGILSDRDVALIQNLVNAAIQANNGIEADALASLGGEGQVRKSFDYAISLTPDGDITFGAERKAMTESELSDLLAIEETPGRYTHISQFGQGGMGRILLTHDQHLDRDIALKELLPTISPDATTVQPNTPVRNLMPVVHRFLQEARITGQLEHPSIVPVYEMGRRKDGHFYYTMKLVRGKTLGKALRECASLEQRMAYLPQFLDLCHAIAYAHGRRVIHRDIKPDNVMVGDFGETVVIDWGLAKVVGKDDVHLAALRDNIESMRSDDATSSSKTRYGEALGTPANMAPEQARGLLEKVDERSDVYSLGTVLYELLTGDLPFEGKSVQAILTQVMNERPKLISECVKDAPPELVAICERAMAQEPSGRYANARELAGEIQRYLSGALVQAYKYRFSEHLRRFAQRNKTALVTAAAGVLALVMVSAISYAKVLSERNRAVIARDDAVEARNGAVVAREEEKKQRESAERQLYVSCIYLARESIDNKRFDVAIRALDQAPEPLRNWEWKYYHRLCHLDERTLIGHGNAVSWAEYSPDGTRVVTSSDDATAKVWDSATGTVLFTLEGHSDQIGWSHFSPDGKRIVTASYDKSAKIWDSVTGKEIVTLAGHSGNVMNAVFSPDGARVATASTDNSARIWDAASGKELTSLTAHTSEVRSVCFVPSSALVVTTSSDATARVWDSTSGKMIHTLAHGGAVLGAQPTADGKRLLTWSRNGEARVWDVESGACLVTADTHGRLCHASFSPDETRIVGSCNEGYAIVFDARNGDTLLTLSGHQRGRLMARYSSDGQRIATASMDKTACLWDAVTGTKLGELLGHSNAIYAVEFSPDNSHVLTASLDGYAKIWSAHNPATPELHTLEGHAGDATGLAVSRDGSRIIISYHNGNATVWELPSGRALFTLTGHKHNIVTARFNADESRIVTSSSDATAIVWDAMTGATLFVLRGHTQGLFDAEFSPDGHRVVTASLDGTAIVWDAASGAQLWALKGHSKGVTSAAFSPDGKMIVTSSGDQSAILWDSTTGAELRTLIGHARGLSSAQFSPDGRHVVTTSGDATAKIWDAATGKELATLRGHKGDVLAAAFSPDRTKVATRSSDGAVILWALDTGQQLVTLPVHTYGITGLCFSPDGKRIITAAANSSARLWDVESGAEMAELHVPTGMVQDAVITPDGSNIVTASGSVAQVWNAS